MSDTNDTRREVHLADTLAEAARRCAREHLGMGKGAHELLCPPCRAVCISLIDKQASLHMVGRQLASAWGGWWPCWCSIAITQPATGSPLPGGRAFAGWVHLHPPADSHCPTCDAKRPGWAAPPETPKARAVYAWTCQCKEPGTTRPWMHKASETSCAMCKVASPYMSDAYLEQLGVDPGVRPAAGRPDPIASEDGGD